MKPKLFIHCASSGNGRCFGIMEELMQSIDKSGYNKNIDIQVYSVGNQLPDMAWFNLNNHDNDYSIGEFHTLKHLKSFCDQTNENVPVGYVHTKGEFSDTQNNTDKRKYMSFFVLEKMSDCINAIYDGYDASGVDWKNIPNRHFSGNFFWLSSLYAKSLPPINPPDFSLDRVGLDDWVINMNVKGNVRDRHLAEFWVGINNPKVKCFF